MTFIIVILTYNIYNIPSILIRFFPFLLDRLSHVTPAARTDVVKDQGTRSLGAEDFPSPGTSHVTCIIKVGVYQHSSFVLVREPSY